jgi:hypothetical protein
MLMLCSAAAFSDIHTIHGAAMAVTLSCTGVEARPNTQHSQAKGRHRGTPLDAGHALWKLLLGAQDNRDCQLLHAHRLDAPELCN